MAHRQITFATLLLACLVCGRGAPAGRTAPTPSLNWSTRHEEERAIDWRAVMAARREVDLAARDLNRIAAEIRTSIENSSEFLDAVSAARQTRRDYQSAAAAVASQLEANTDFRALQWKLRNLEAILDATREKHGLSDRRVLEAARELMQLRRAITASRAAALNADPTLADARLAMIDASRRLSDLRATIQPTILSDRTWIDARDRLDQARQRLARAG